MVLRKQRLGLYTHLFRHDIISKIFCLFLIYLYNLVNIFIFFLNFYPFDIQIIATLEKITEYHKSIYITFVI